MEKEWPWFYRYGQIILPSTNIHMPYQGTFEDAFPFPSVGYVNSPGVYFLLVNKFRKFSDAWNL